MRSDFSCLRSSLRSPQDPLISWPLRRVLLPGCSRTACLGRVIVGMGLMMFLVAFSLGDVVLASPALFLILKLSGIGFLFWLAWQIASAGHSDATAERQPLGFVGAAAFQWINPKSPLHMLPDGSFACMEQS